MILFYERSKAWEANKANTWLLFSALMLGLTASGKYIYCVAGVAVVAHWIWYQFKERKTEQLLRSLGLLLGWGLLSILFFILSNPYLWADTFTRLQETISFHGNYATTAAEVQNAGYPVWQPFVWLFSSVPWHPGVFVYGLDLLITAFAIFGFRQTMRKRPVFGIWLITSLVFLLLWPTKWAQYILVLMFPWCYAAAEGVMHTILLPVLDFFKRVRRDGWASLVKAPSLSALTRSQKPLLWLLPGLVRRAMFHSFP